MTGAFDQQPSKVRYQRYEAKYGRHQADLKNEPVFSDVLDTGYCVIPGFWNAAQCQAARQAIDEYLDSGKRDGIRVWTDALQADQRIMGAENLSHALNLFDDSSIKGIITRLYNKQELPGFSMAARLAALDGNLGSGQGWHRDSCIEYQFKAILYLSDVKTENGPFQYYQHSAKTDEILRLESQYGISMNENRLDQYQTHFDDARIVELCGAEGTLIIADTRGIHRGKPMVKGERYALTNYYWRNAIPEAIVEWVNTAQQHD